MMSEHAWLVCDRLNAAAFLADGDKLQEAQAYYLRRVARPVALVVADLALLHRAFRDLVGPEGRVFSKREVAAVVGVNPPVIHWWVTDRLIRPGVRGRGTVGRKGLGFSWWDAFVAAVLGTLARAGCDTKTMKEASRLLYGSKDIRRGREEANVN